MATKRRNPRPRLRLVKRRRPTCSLCGEYGHNKANCPHRDSPTMRLYGRARPSDAELRQHNPARRCSVCRRSGHDKRHHRNVRGRRLNPDWFIDSYGRPHPVRGSPGYDEAFVGIGRHDKNYMRGGPRRGYTEESPGREIRVAEARARRRVRRTGRPKGSTLPYHMRQDVEAQRFKKRATRTLY